jgi:hopanoid biosynthesis associated protein HpnK
MWWWPMPCRFCRRRIPALVNSKGRLPSDLVGVGVRCFFAPAARKQLRQEIEAQFAAFHATGLTCDHINAHNHMHLHPTVLGIILDCARTYGIKHIRLPYEPARLAGAGGARRMIAAILIPWLAMMRWRFRRAGLTSNDCLAGLTATGHMNETRVLAALEQVADGATEFYFHPALGVTEALKAEAADYDRLGELDALLSPAVTRRMRELGLVPCVFRDLT